MEKNKIFIQGLDEPVVVLDSRKGDKYILFQLQYKEYIYGMNSLSLTSSY